MRSVLLTYVKCASIFSRLLKLWCWGKYRVKYMFSCFSQLSLSVSYYVKLFRQFYKMWNDSNYVSLRLALWIKCKELLRCHFRVLCGWLWWKKLFVVSVQPEVHVDAEGRDLTTLQESPGRRRPAARRGAARGLHHPGAAPRKAGLLP